MRSSHGKSKKVSKKIREGTLRKSKGRPLQCKHCGKFFADLGEVNRHYSAAGHKKTKHPPKGFKLDPKRFTREKIERAVALLEILENPVEFRKRLKEALAKREYRRFRDR